MQKQKIKSENLRISIGFLNFILQLNGRSVEKEIINKSLLHTFHLMEYHSIFRSFNRLRFLKLCPSQFDHLRDTTIFCRPTLQKYLSSNTSLLILENLPFSADSLRPFIFASLCKTKKNTINSLLFLFPQNKKTSLLLLMPNTVHQLPELRANLFRENFFDILDALPQQETQIMIPQMSAVTNNLELIPFLKLLGIASVFKASNTNYSKNKSNVYVQSVKQSAFFSTGFSALNTIGTVSTKLNTSE